LRSLSKRRLMLNFYVRLGCKSYRFILVHLNLRLVASLSFGYVCDAYSKANLGSDLGLDGLQNRLK